MEKMSEWKKIRIDHALSRSLLENRECGWRWTPKISRFTSTYRYLCRRALKCSHAKCWKHYTIMICIHIHTENKRMSANIHTGSIKKNTCAAATTRAKAIAKAEARPVSTLSGQSFSIISKSKREKNLKPMSRQKKIDETIKRPFFLCRWRIET